MSDGKPVPKCSTIIIMKTFSIRKCSKGMVNIRNIKRSLWVSLKNYKASMF